MIRNKLSDLLGQRQIKISRLSALTGIARSTLTPIYFNHSEMIKIETINKICKALNINVSEFFESVNFDINFTIDEDSTDNIFTFIETTPDYIGKFNIDIGSICEISEQNTRYLLDVSFKAIDETMITDSVIWIDFHEGDGDWLEENSKIVYQMNFDTKENEEIFNEYLKKLSVGMKILFKNKTTQFLREQLLKEFSNDLSNQNYNVPKQKFKDIFTKADIEIENM
ncbi:helix-turn-helix transcriptional regulator [Staphylococcus massiliensis]|uniref:helix-turn-helix domain-containing protein n=1 Tax=Staphylococcus massiliensis TaxID=555791 RepID=UPI001EE123A7|nr:helix-turn-helix transcriptional regulator [Staphylococcus massiliensis]MCG3412717.1 helix-turn-helix transcriptional regulator [Staphylococcus massiliensis]